MTSHVFTSTHEFYWSNREPVPIGEIAETLLALERIVKMTPKVLEGLTQIEIGEVKVYVEAIESGSLLEKIIIKVFFKDEQSLDAFLDKVGEKVRQPGMTRNALIAAVLAAVVGYGAWLAAKVSNPGGQTTISGNNTTIINIGAGQVEMTPETFKAIVETAIKDQKTLAKETVKLFNPARADSQASIVIDGNDALTFSPAVIAATPRKVEIDQQQNMEHLPDVDLQIRALDRDSGKRGWACVIPGKIEKRVRLELDDAIRPVDIAGKFSVRASVYVYYKPDRSGNKMIPDYVKLFRLVDL